MDATELARGCLAEHSNDSQPCLRYWNGEWYRWTGCAYRKLSTDEVKRRIFMYLGRTAAKSVSRSVINAVLDTMKLLTLVEGATIPCWLSQAAKYAADQMVAAKNGLLHLPGLVRPIFDTSRAGLPILFWCAKDLCQFEANEAETVVPQDGRIVNELSL